MALVRYTRACLEAAQAWPPAGRSWSGAGRKRPRSITVFESPLIERFLARALPISPILWCGPVFAVTAYESVRSPAALRLKALPLFLGGWFMWSLLEYFLHRFIFHLNARSTRQRLRAFLLHGYHHEFPDDAMRLVAPPLMSWPIAIVVALTLYGLVGPPAWLPIFAGMAAGYLAYDW